MCNPNSVPRSSYNHTHNHNHKFQNQDILDGTQANYYIGFRNTDNDNAERDNAKTVSAQKIFGTTADERSGQLNLFLGSIGLIAGKSHERL